MPTSYDEFLPWVLPSVPNCAEITATWAIREAAIRFCEESLIHQVDHDPVSVVAHQADYDLDAPEQDTKVYKVMKVWLSGREITPMAPDFVGDPAVYNQQIGGYDTVYNRPVNFIQKDASTFSLFPVPSESVSNAVTMRVALSPLRKSKVCADFLFEFWAETIAAGALSTLQSTPGRSYTNVEAAAINDRRFTFGINDARQKASSGFNRSNLRVRFRRP